MSVACDAEHSEARSDNSTDIPGGEPFLQQEPAQPG